jgi:hypothetical protein
MRQDGPIPGAHSTRLRSNGSAVRIPFITPMFMGSRSHIHIIRSVVLKWLCSGSASAGARKCMRSWMCTEATAVFLSG